VEELEGEKLGSGKVTRAIADPDDDVVREIVFVKFVVIPVGGIIRSSTSYFWFIFPLNKVRLRTTLLPSCN